MLLQLMQIEGQILFVETLLAEVIELVFVCEVLPNHLLDLGLYVGFALVLVPVRDLVIMHWQRSNKGIEGSERETMAAEK